MRRACLTLLVAALWLASPAERSRAEPPTPEQVRFFETRIRPLLAEQCYRCHGPKKQWADLRLDSRDGILKGGESGPADRRGPSREKPADPGRAPRRRSA